MNKTLYVSDLDGTLLRHDETISKFSIDTINKLIDNGLLFSYATARSYITASKVTYGLNPRLPLIIYNGSFIFDKQNNRFLFSNFFSREDIYCISEILLSNNLYPIVYSFQNMNEIFSYIDEKISPELRAFLSQRTNDKRNTAVDSIEKLLDGDIFYFTCIGKENELNYAYSVLKEKYHCIFGKDIYSGHYWLEILKPTATKAHTVLKLKEILDCDKLVVFGDGINDIEMFKVADKSYAMSNADQSLKQIATDIIGSNEEDSVARWLLKNI